MSTTYYYNGRVSFSKDLWHRRLYMVLFRGLMQRYTHGLISMLDLGAIDNVEFTIKILLSEKLENRLLFKRGDMYISHIEMVHLIKQYRLIDVLAHNEICHYMRQLLQNNSLHRVMTLSDTLFQP